MIISVGVIREGFSEEVRKACLKRGSGPRGCRLQMSSGWWDSKHRGAETEAEVVDSRNIREARVAEAE